MRVAVNRATSSSLIIDIDKWVVHNHGDTPSCPICGEAMRISADLSTERATHFAHQKGSKCPTVKAAANAYSIFKAVERSGPAEARKVKQYALDNIESIYYRASANCPQLKWKEFLPLLEKATDWNAWSFKDFNVNLIPYMLLCCADEFRGKRNTARPKTIFFVLDPSAGNAEFWHKPSDGKRFIWRVVKSTRNVTEIAMQAGEVEPWYRAKARINLKL